MSAHSGLAENIGLTYSEGELIIMKKSIRIHDDRQKKCQYHADKTNPALAILFGSAAIAIGALFVVAADAQVTGICSNCHTMHNSQDGKSLAIGGDGRGWNSSGELTGTLQDKPNTTLLMTDCVGCHSSSTDQTIMSVGGSRIPIVFNTGGYPSNPLAGGNFYYMSQGESYQGYGHNVYGIASTDTALSEAPGRWESSCSGTSCHATLAEPPSMENLYRGGCQGCHYNVYHHNDNGNYRFLNSHNGPNAYVSGVEDEDWEQNPSMSDRNIYQGDDGTTGPQTLADTHSISSYCGGCHWNFHKMTETGGGSSPWLRHPTDFILPTDASKEYSNYDPTATYSNLAPVAWINPSSSTPARSEAVVMCLSCHRPHATDQPDMLRWDYANCQAGTDNADCGCFVCHTTKDAG